MDKKTFMMNVIVRGLFETPVIVSSEDEPMTIVWTSSDHGKSWFKDLSEIASTLREVADAIDSKPNELLGEHDESNYMDWS